MNTWVDIDALISAGEAEEKRLRDALLAAGYGELQIAEVAGAIEASFQKPVTTEDRERFDRTCQLATGTILGGKYRLSRRIGQGAMGAVWAAVNQDTSREVAVKLILGSEPELRQRFMREARSCGALKHPNVIDIFDVAQTASGEPFLVMELLSGETLSQLLARKRRLEPMEAARIALAVARALEAAHARGIVHRDLKSANIFLHTTPGEGEPMVKVLDFGMANNVTSDDGLKTSLGNPVGSPAYMSPEQARADSTVDHRSDIWSLGILLFQMLAGVRPFTGESHLLLSKILKGPIPTLGEIVRGADPQLSEIIARCLKRDRNHRFRSATEIAELLEPVATGRGSQGAGGSPLSPRSLSVHSPQTAGPDPRHNEALIPMKVLIVDAHRTARRVLRQMLSAMPRVEILEAGTVDDAMTTVTKSAPDLLLLDIRLSEDPGDHGGIEVLKRLRASGRSTPAVMVTSLADGAEVREAMRQGAQDYILKDELCPETLLPIVEATRERLLLTSEVVRPRDIVARPGGTKAILGSSPAIKKVRQLIERVADVSSTVLIRGDTGTGKEMVARALHELSSRRDDPFIAVNCSTLPGTLIESLIFGHERGAFTGAERRARGQLELAGAGTILLDEIAEMPGELQAKLLRVLEDRRYRPLGAETELPLRARVLASTHVDLERRMNQGRFRRDLFYRLHVVTIVVPPLSARSEDIGELLQSFVAECSRKLRFTDEAVAWLERRPWLGNVRELRNVVDRIALLADEDEITVRVLEELAADQPGSDATTEIDRLAQAVLGLPERVGSKLRTVERAVLRRAMEISGGNKAAAARLLGVDRKMLERKLERDRNEESGNGPVSGPPSSRRLGASRFDRDRDDDFGSGPVSGPPSSRRSGGENDE
jgi:DNA-binding NtrC family response regulator